jgi:hypothetical protein
VLCLCYYLIGKQFPAFFLIKLLCGTDILNHYFLVGDPFPLLFLLNIPEELFNFIFSLLFGRFFSFLRIFAYLGIRTAKIRIFLLFWASSQMLVTLELHFDAKFGELAFGNSNRSELCLDLDLLALERFTA